LLGSRMPTNSKQVSHYFDDVYLLTQKATLKTSLF
jgi:hypothetical protein